MMLEHELGLKKGFTVLEHEAILNIYYTASQIKKQADEFFQQFGLTDVQFNVMMLLHYQSGSYGGLGQAQLSNMMLVNRANITSLIDRMEKAGLVMRTSAANDRRSNIIKMTAKGQKLFAKVEPIYGKLVKNTMAILKPIDQKKLISSLEAVRGALKV
jgi:DNA-binding MarR family transcriptional regulator